MSQTNDPNGYETEGSSALKNVANEAGKVVAIGGSNSIPGNFSSGAKEILQVSQRWIGNSTYVFGGGRNQSDITKGRFDCSSFVHWFFAQQGVDLGPLTGNIETFRTACIT